MKNILFLLSIVLLTSCSYLPIAPHTKYAEASLNEETTDESVSSDSVIQPESVVDFGQPRYPRQAAIDGVSGWVRFNFDIDEEGYATNLKVTDSYPEGVFEKEAVRAMKKWRFDTSLAGRTNMSYTLRFQLNG